MVNLDDYQFENWVPEHVQNLIKKFWGFHGGAKKWLEDHKQQGLTEYCHHGPNPNGFGMPPNGAWVIFIVKDYKATTSDGYYALMRLYGRYIHTWNNMGIVVKPDGTHEVVSTCDMWVRLNGELNYKN